MLGKLACFIMLKFPFDHVTFVLSLPHSSSPLHSVQSAFAQSQTEQLGGVRAASPVLHTVWFVSAVTLRSSVAITHCQRPAPASESFNAGVQVVEYVCELDWLAKVETSREACYCCVFDVLMSMVYFFVFEALALIMGMPPLTPTVVSSLNPTSSDDYRV